jgi:hypothetical protein
MTRTIFALSFVASQAISIMLGYFSSIDLGNYPDTMGKSGSGAMVLFPLLIGLLRLGLLPFLFTLRLEDIGHERTFWGWPLLLIPEIVSGLFLSGFTVLATIAINLIAINLLVFGYGFVMPTNFTTTKKLDLGVLGMGVAYITVWFVLLTFITALRKGVFSTF